MLALVYCCLHRFPGASTLRLPLFTCETSALRFPLCSRIFGLTNLVKIHQPVGIQVLYWPMELSLPPCGCVHLTSWSVPYRRILFNQVHLSDPLGPCSMYFPSFHICYKLHIWCIKPFIAMLPCPEILTSFKLSVRPMSQYGPLT